MKINLNDRDKVEQVLLKVQGNGGEHTLGYDDIVEAAEMAREELNRRFTKTSPGRKKIWDLQGLDVAFGYGDKKHKIGYWNNEKFSFFGTVGILKFGHNKQVFLVELERGYIDREACRLGSQVSVII